MKKLIVLIGAVLIANSAFGQFGLGLDWGVKGGVNFTHLTNSDLDFGTMKMDSKMKTSFYVGVFAEFPFFLDFLGIQPEIIYSRQGNFYKESGIKVWNRANYLNIPVMFKFYVLNDLSVDVGPQFGFLLNGKMKTKTGGTTTKHSTSSDFKTFDLSFGMGLSYRITHSLDASIRYNLGLTKAAKDKNDGDKSKNGALQVGVGYRF